MGGLTCIPIFEMAALVMPGASMGTTIRDLLAWGFPWLVLARRQAQSACSPLVIHILVPEMTRSPPSLLAVVVRAATSLPPPGSLT